MLTTEKTKAMIAFGNEIKRLRVNLGLTQGELASEIKNCQTYISQLEKATSLASARMLDKLVDWFKDAGITIDEGILEDYLRNRESPVLQVCVISS